MLHDRWPIGYHPLRKDVPADVAPPWADVPFEPFTAEGEGVYQLPVGPIHAGIIEPGHFRFSAVGERVLHLDARLFFTHRGLEKLAEGRSLDGALALVERACGVCTVTHALAYSQAVEQLTGHRRPGPGELGAGPPRRDGAPLQPRRRPGQHLRRHRLQPRHVAAGCAEGAAAAAQRGGRRPSLPDGHASCPAVCGEDLAADGLAAPAGGARRRSATSWRLPSGVILRSDGVHARLHGAGAVSMTLAAALGASGVAARAAGHRHRPASR